MMRLTMMLFALSACGPKTAETVEVDFRASAPEPLPRGVFKLPVAQEATLSNGLVLRYVQDATVPMTRVTLAFRLGSFADPEGKTGLVAATFDMLNEGVEGHDALGISLALKRLGGSLSSGAGIDGGHLTVSSLTRNLDEVLGFLTKALLQPTFPTAEWERIQKGELQNLSQTKTTPRSMSRRVFKNAFYGGDYNGRLTTEESIKALNVEDMSGWWVEHAVVENAMLVASSDLSLEEILPKLEEALGAMPSGAAAQTPSPKGIVLEQTEIRFVHKPGASQSVLRMGREFGAVYGDEDYWPIRVANRAFGGMFMARLNMNLREDKGYSYGARSWTTRNFGADRWELSTSVRTDVTAASLFEVFKELAELSGDAPVRPLSPEELAYAQGSSINGYPAQFETPSTLLQQLSEIWRYGLPADAVEAYIANVESVQPDAAQAAFAARIASQPLLVVVVGDWEVVGESVSALGYPVTQVDVDGQEIQSSEE
jgi:predicted Zn-dependent peptidase